MNKILNIKKVLKKTFIYTCYYRFRKYRWVKIRKSQLLKEAIEKFQQERPAHGSLADYKKALKKHFVSYSEYMYQYEFWHLSEQEKQQFIARDALRLFYYDIPWKVKNTFWNKVNFLNLFSKYIYRDWICVNSVSYNVFCSFINQVKECIVKPLDNCCGLGIHKIVASEIVDYSSLYRDLGRENILLEECINECEELRSFHPKSLNSIRVVTVYSHEKVVVFGAFFRMGVGESVIDNAHAGGLFAQINVDTGLIESEGIDINGNRYIKHPDTHKWIKGFQIPRWDEIKSICIEASKIVPENPITGWDVVIDTKGNIEFIEGNHGPDFDVMQSPLKIGVKSRLYNLLES